MRHLQASRSHHAKFTYWMGGVMGVLALIGANFNTAHAASSVDAYNKLEMSLAVQEDILLQVVLIAGSTEVLLMRALALDELADKQEQRQKNLEAIEDKADALESVIAEDAEAEAEKEAQIDAAMAEKKKLNEEQQKHAFGAFMNTVTIVFNVPRIVQSSILIGTNMTMFVTSMINPLEAINFALAVKAAGMKPKEVKERLDRRFKNIKNISKRMDDTAKRNDKLIKEILKENELEPPKDVQPTTIGASSAL